MAEVGVEPTSEVRRSPRGCSLPRPFKSPSDSCFVRVGRPLPSPSARVCLLRARLVCVLVGFRLPPGMTGAAGLGTPPRCPHPSAPGAGEKKEDERIDAGTDDEALPTGGMDPLAAAGSSAPLRWRSPPPLRPQVSVRGGLSLRQPLARWPQLLAQRHLRLQ